MRVEIVLGDEFKRQFRHLAKKYPSLKDDFVTFKKELSDAPGKEQIWVVALAR